MSTLRNVLEHVVDDAVILALILGGVALVSLAALPYAVAGIAVWIGLKIVVFRRSIAVAPRGA